MTAFVLAEEGFPLRIGTLSIVGGLLIKWLLGSKCLEVAVKASENFVVVVDVHSAGVLKVDR